MQNFDIVGALAFFTIGAVLVFGIISWIRANKAQAQHKDAAVAQRQRKEDRAEGRDDRFTEPRDDHTAPTDSGRSWSKDRGANPPTAPITPPD